MERQALGIFTHQHRILDMPDLWMDVDAALTEVPVNIMPLIDDTDFKSIEISIAYNASGMDLVWNFVTTAGVFTQTAVTPTTSGDYDWTHQGDGMYTIEITASGGASINNDTEGHGWFTGFVTGVLPWRGPIIGFRASGINDLLVDSAYSTTRGLSGTALPDSAAEALNGLYTRGTGAGQINQDANGRVDSNVAAISGDSTAADNAEATYDGTGYSDGNAPATQDQVASIASSGGGGGSFEFDEDNTSASIKSISFVGVQTGTVANVSDLDGTNHQVDDTANEIDIVYGASIGGTRTGSTILFDGFLNGGNDELNVLAYDFVGAAWNQIGTLTGKSGTTNDSNSYEILNKHTGTSGADLGKIYIRFQNTGQSNPDLNVDRLWVSTTITNQSVGYLDGAVWIDTTNGTAGTVSDVNGTADNPSLTLADAMTILSNKNLQVPGCGRFVDNGHSLHGEL